MQKKLGKRISNLKKMIRNFTTVCSLICLFSLLIRVYLYLSVDAVTLQRRIELVTPATSWFRVKECIGLIDLKISPYEGDTCHHLPLAIHFFRLLKGYGENAVLAFFITMDLLTGISLAFGVQKYTVEKVQREKSECHMYKDDSKQLWLGTIDVTYIPYLTLVLYLFNPYSILSCVAFSTGLTSNMFHALIFLLLVQGHHFLAAAVVGIASYLSFYSVIILVVVLLRAVEMPRSGRWFYPYELVSSLLVTCLGTIGILLLWSNRLTKTWGFIDATHGFLWRVPDLTPNIGLFWYFFMEMFDHFKTFFLWIFQINIFVYVIPMGVLFRNRPVFLYYILMSIIALFKSYPAVCDLCIPLALLPCWSYLYRYMRTVFIIVCIFVFTAVLGPILYYLWIYAGSGNANFFYAVTLVFGLGQIFLVSDMVVAYLRREFHLVFGLEPKTEDGEYGIVVFQ